MELVGTEENAYLIVGVFASDSGGQPELFWWDGKNQPTPGPQVSWEGLVPEALFAWSDGTLQILGDNDEECSEGDDPDDRYFSSIEIDFWPASSSP